MKYLLIFLLCVTFTSVHAQSTPAKEHFHCAGTNAAGKACGQIVKTKGTKCRFHTENKVTCDAPTKSGGKCKMVVKTKGQRCWRHAQ